MVREMNTSGISDKLVKTQDSEVSGRLIYLLIPASLVSSRDSEPGNVRSIGVERRCYDLPILSLVLGKRSYVVAFARWSNSAIAGLEQRR